jgi:hypothetical protein
MIIFLNTFSIVAAIENYISDRHRQHRIIREKTIGRKKFKLLCFDVIKFVDRTNNVPSDRPT